MLRWHRLIALIGLPIVLYVVLTGAGVEFWDMVALVGKAPEESPDMLRMREHILGAPNFAVITARDYTAPALPARLDYPAAMDRAASLGRAAAPGATLRLVELRSYRGRLTGHVQMDGRQFAFDLASSRPVPATDVMGPQSGPFLYAPRAAFKSLHRLFVLGNLGTLVNFVAGLLLSVLVVTGLSQYWKVYKARMRKGRRSPFWSGNTVWRTTHRSISLLAAVPMLWLILSGLALSVDNIVPGVKELASGPPHGPGPDPFFGDFSAPLDTRTLPQMTQATLAAFRRDHPDTGIRTIRIRYFSGYPQGIVIADDAEVSQLVYDTRDGRSLSMSEPGYPKLIYPTGWDLHQSLKRVHRGDFFGMPGRWLASFAALSLLYMLASGVTMYVQLYRRRANNGKREVVWGW